MSASAPGLCGHCVLPLGAWPYEGEVQGRARSFCCYGCFIGWQAAHGGGEESAAARLLIRLGFGMFLAMNIMLFSLMLYAGGGDAAMRPLFHGLLWLLATPVLIALGGPFLAESAVALARGRFSPSLLIALGSSAAYLYSALAVLEGGDKVYFDTATMVLVLFTLGRTLEAQGRARATRSLRPFMEAEGATVCAVLDGSEAQLPLAEVRPGTIVRVEPGERILIDGKVREGVSEAEEAYLTGEARPVPKRPGSQVLAGSWNGEGALLVEASVPGLESRWFAICREVRAALSRPSRTQRIADRAASAFVPAVIALAAGTALVHWHVGSADALMAGLAVLVVACPCALGLAAPLATTIAVADLARRGVLLRSGAALEALAGVRAVVFDKTGTLTSGRPCCVAIASDGVDEATLLRRAAAVASGSRHPLSRAVIDAARARRLRWRQASEIEAVPGMGVRGLDGGTCVLYGSRRWLAGQGLAIPDALDRSASSAERQQGRMIALVAWDGAARGLFAFDDEARGDAARLVRSLRADGLAVSVLSGDGARQTERLCAALGIDCWSAELSPEDKRAALCAMPRGGAHVAMVGDGMNDALAMTASAIGIAAGEPAEPARETAEVVLPPEGLGLLPHLLRTARRTRRAIAANLAWAFGYNAIAIALAAAGLLQPVLAAALMAGSSLVVIGNTAARLSSVRLQVPVSTRRVGEHETA